MSQRVPFMDLRPGPDAADVQGAIQRVIDRGWFILGPELQAFEEEFAAAMGGAFSVGVGTGTDAIALLLRGLGIGPGDEVITAPVSAAYSALAIMMVGARPVFADLDPQRLTLDPRAAEAAITSRTRAIMPVHLYGQPADMDAIQAVAARRGIPVIEDACQAHGAQYRGQRAGGLGLAAAFSFYPGKNLGALGDGGAVVTNDADVAAQGRLLRNHGQEDKYTHSVVGYCDRLHNLQAAFLSAKLAHLDERNDARRQAATRYDAMLAGVTGVTSLATIGDAVHVHHLYVVLVDDRDRVRDVLAGAGIETGVHYPVPLHLTPAYRSLGYASGDFPVAEALAQRILSLPMHPHLSEAQTEYVAEQLVKAVE